MSGSNTIAGIGRAMCLAVLLASLLGGCGILSDVGGTPPPMTKNLGPEVRQAKSIFVFLDGTRNDVGTGTNVRKLFDVVLQANDPETVAIYIEGVGSAENPISGMALGYGMQPRILRGYDFIAQAYDAKAAPDIYIFGFSRGAHQARALAGLIAYAGLPPRSTDDIDTRLEQGRRILKVVKGMTDRENMPLFKVWSPGAPAPGLQEVSASLNISMIPVETAFLGLWDTVPGSAFKDFGECTEDEDRRKGDRYKSHSYPSIRAIHHAVSYDEKRSRFRPLLVCKAINEKYTKVEQVLFPGARADVGGGYGTADGLPNLSLRWMIDRLQQKYAPRLPAEQFNGDPLAVAHWSIDDFPANLFSRCLDRKFEPVVVAQENVLDASIASRMKNAPVPVLIDGREEKVGYPRLCR